jgi:ATP synthase subunit 6
MIYSPLEQFNIFSLFTIFEISSETSYTALAFTNSNYFLLVNCLIFLFLMNLLVLNTNGTIVPNRLQYVVEQLYEFVLDMIIGSIDAKAVKYINWVFTIFILLLIINLSGMVPYSFTVTSHIIVTFWLALGLFIGINIIAIQKHKIQFLNLFFPPGAPLMLAPLLVGIEVISYFIRVVSLSVRLFANMMSGHILLKVLLGFAWSMMTANEILYIVHFLPLLSVFLLLGLEIGVA